MDTTPVYRWIVVCTCATAGAAALTCQESPEPPAPPSAAPAAQSSAAAAPTAAPRVVVSAADKQAFAVLPAVFEAPDNPMTEAKIALGRQLFFETRLSRNHDVSCNTCHRLDTYGVDHEPTSRGHKGLRGGRNSPTVYNAGGHVAQFWDGRATTLEEQAKGPILNPIEMAMPDEATVVRTLRSIPGYVEAFARAFPGDAQPITYDNMAKAIGAFERKLQTPSRFDRWLGGDEGALSDVEVAGLSRFVQLGCPTCHNGPAVGGTTFQKLGLVNAWPDESDIGQGGVTKKDGDRMRFRVPSLRNIEETHPYFHGGQVAKLEDVVKLMAWHQLGVRLGDEDTKLLLAFLGCLTGELPAEYVSPPELPPSGPTTPRPDPR
jgi:cytochrome c peroxidase